MQWQEIRNLFPNQWLLIEALKAHTDETDERVLEDVAVVDKFETSSLAMKKYVNLHRQDPSRELYVIHTKREKTEIRERKWAGLRKT